MTLVSWGGEGGGRSEDGGRRTKDEGLRDMPVSGGHLKSMGQGIIREVLDVLFRSR